MLLRTVWNLQNASLGLDQQHVLTASLILGPHQRRNPGARTAFYNQLQQRIEALPGAESVAVSDTIPPGGPMHSMIYSLIEVEGRSQSKEGTGGMAGWRSVSPGYFRALGIRMAKGRAFTEEDRRIGGAMILSRSLAARLFQSEDAIGKKIRTGGRSGPWRTVVGIAEDVANAGVRAAPAPEYYLVRRLQAEPFVPGSVPPEAEPRASIIVRSSLAAETMTQAIKREVASLAPALPVNVETMRSRVLDLTEGPRFHAIVLSSFAITALLLAAIGLYGVIGFMVAQRTREIGIRMALGATGSGVQRIVLAGAAKVIAIGLIAGLAVTLPATRLLKQTLFGIPEKDPVTLAAACAMLIVTGLCAAYLPARRASRVDPAVALRHDYWVRTV